MEAKQDNLDFLNRFGDMSTLRNDFRLIKRSKRVRTTALMSLLLFYMDSFF